MLQLKGAGQCWFYKSLHKILNQSIVARHVVIKKGETYLHCVDVSDQTPVQMKTQSDKMTSNLQRCFQAQMADRRKWMCFCFVFFFFKNSTLSHKAAFVVLETGSRKKHYCTLFSFLCNSLISISYLINALLYYSACSAQRNSTRCAAFKAEGVCCSLEDPSRWSCVQRSVFKGYSNTREYRY